MDRTRILICDDRNDDAIAQTVREAAGDVDVTVLQGNAFRGALTEFFQVVDVFLKSAGRNEADIPRSAFDGYDIILVDNNLAELAIPGARLTAEAILGSLRAFSSSSYLVSLNKNPLVDFDLRYLIGDFATRADIALNEGHLGNPALWSESVEVGDFAPWYWPELKDAANRRKKQIAFVEANLDNSIVNALGIPDEVRRQLPSRAIGFLDPAATVAEGVDGSPLDVTTFWHHFRSSNRSLPMDDRIAIATGGQPGVSDARKAFLEGGGAVAGVASRRIAARIVAAELDLWLRRDLLGPQEFLVDAPHLRTLVGVRLTDDEGPAWNSAISESEAPLGFDPGFYDSVLASRRFEQSDWVPRPAFWWPLIEEDAQLTAFRERGKRETMLVFMEDTRRFLRVANDPPPWRFVPENGQPWSPRFVERIPGYNYSPSSAFAR